MTSCPKCRSYRIHGPSYHKDGYGRESLIYTCAACGFKKHEATADSDSEAQQRFPVEFYPRSTKPL